MRDPLGRVRSPLLSIVGFVPLLVGACGKSANQLYTVTASFPHDTGAYTQGLLFHDGALYESTGEYGHSSLRRVDPVTGKTVASLALPPSRFGEGLALVGARLYQLTWQTHIGYVYDATTLRLVDSFPYEGEGWGLTSDGTSLIMSDGTETLRFIDPRTYRVIRRVVVRDGQSPLSQVNELELVHGLLLANVYQSDWIVIIDPATGQILRWIDCADLLPARLRTLRTDVLNGIAYDDAQRRLFVTGKRWPRLFELRLTFSLDSLRHAA
jgi:glutamine cyclotransferase